MDTITVSVKELAQMVKKLTDNNMDFVEVAIDEPLDPIDSDDENETIPACLSFSAWSEEVPFMEVDFGSIDVVNEIE